MNNFKFLPSILGDTSVWKEKLTLKKCYCQYDLINYPLYQDANNTVVNRYFLEVKLSVLTYVEHRIKFELDNKYGQQCSTFTKNDVTCASLFGS